MIQKMMLLVGGIFGVVLPILLGAYGTHLALLAIRDREKRRARYWIVWGLVVASVVCVVAQGIGADRSQRRHDAQQAALLEQNAALQAKQDESVRTESVVRQRLESFSSDLQAVKKDPCDTSQKDALAKLDSKLDEIKNGLPKHYKAEGVEILRTSDSVRADHK